MSHIRNRNPARRRIPQHLPTTAKLGLRVETSATHCASRVIRISASRTAPRSPRVRPKQSARDRHQHIRRFERDILFRLLRQLPAEHLFPLAAVRALRVRRQPNRHSQSRQHQHRHPIRWEKQHPYGHNWMEPDDFLDSASLGGKSRYGAGYRAFYRIYHTIRRPRV